MPDTPSNLIEDSELEGLTSDQPVEILEDGDDETPTSGLVSIIKERFLRAEEERRTDENRWLQAYRNYRGVYDETTAFRKGEKSRVFVKITKTKVLAAYGQLIEVMFAANKFPIIVEPTRLPEGIAEFAHTDTKPDQDIAKQIDDQYGYAGDGKEMLSGSTSLTPVGEMRKLKELDMVEGPAPDGEGFIQVNPAAIAAKKLQKIIHDQLDASSAANVLRHACFEMSLLGTGVIKGPFNEHKTINNWVKSEEGEGRTYKPYTKVVPKISSVSLFDFYPDPQATLIDDAEWVIERHKMSRSQLRGLKRRPYFRTSAITSCLEHGENYIKQSFEDQLRENTNNPESSRFEVLEYWGMMDKDLAHQAGLDMQDDMEEMDEIQINVWVCGNEILRLVLNPFTPDVIPYQVCPYEINPYSMFGIGVSENMEDSQMIMNGHARMAIDNLALAGNLVFDVDETALVAGQDYNIYPGKVFRRQGGMPGQAIYALKFPSTANENLQMFDRFRQFADEETGIPSFSHGLTGVQGTGRTASGISMLMGAAALSIKTVVKNLDHFMLRPIGERFFNWNMQFNDDDELEFRGDLEIRARGTAALMQKEVRSQRLMMFLQLAASPVFAPLVRWSTALEDLADSLDLDPEKILNSPEEAKIAAKLIGLQKDAEGQGTGQPNASPSGQPDIMGGAQGMGGGQTAADPTGAGGGTIGTGNVPAPGTPGFSA